MTKKEKMVQTFREKAEAVSAVVSDVTTMNEAYEYAANLCAKKEACQLLISGCEAPLSPDAEDLCQLKEMQKIMAAPGMKKKDINALSKVCKEYEVSLIDKGLRHHLAGIDIGFTVCDYGIADTGTLVPNSSNEELRLATMISEIHVAVLPLSKLQATSYDLEKEMGKWMNKPPNYTAFITGASRTADIERVLALGVHGPLELHILLLEDSNARS